MELKKFNEKVEIIGNKLAKYQDEEGNILVFPASA